MNISQKVQINYTDQQFIIVLNIKYIFNICIMFLIIIDFMVKFNCKNYKKKFIIKVKKKHNLCKTIYNLKFLRNIN